MAVDFRSGYVPPGVYVSADSSAVSSSVGAGPTVVCLVGPSLGYRTFVDYVTFPNSDAITLTQKGIIESSVVIQPTSDTSVTYNEGEDWTLVPNSSDADKSDLSIVDSGNIQANTPLIVSYRFTDDAFYGLNQFSDFTTLKTVYGDPFTEAGVLQSPLSFAAQIAFENGANVVYAITLTPSGAIDSRYKNAYDLTLTNYDINLIVPIFDVVGSQVGPLNLGQLTNYIAQLKSHLQDADSAGYPRNAIVGVPETFDAAVTPDQIATLFNYRRVVVVWPNRLTYYNSLATSNPYQVVGGSYLAAACAGVLANNITAQGLTRRQIYSINGIAPDIAPAQTTVNKNTWSSRGVAVMEQNRTGALVIRHGVTTDMTSVVSREFSIVRCQDELFREVQQSLEAAQLIGTPITASTALAVKGTVAGALESALADQTIQSYSNLAVRQQNLPNGDPTVIECTFAYQPTYPLNYIQVKFTFDLSTGDITSTTDTADTAA
jgi:hypothetical protein